jgi:hypothetical protein
VQGASDPQRELLDVESVAGHLLPAGSVFAFLAEHRGRLFPAAMFDDLFPSGRGRPSLPPELVASVLVLQTLQGLSDREAVEAVTFDLRWKAAVGLAVTDAGFHPTTLTYWRSRLAASESPNRIFDAVRGVVTATGVLAGRTRRALDSTVLDDAVARQDTVTQLIAAVRRVGRVVPGAGDLVARVCTGYDYTRAGKPDIAWDDEQAREDLVSVLVNDTLALLAAVQDRLEDHGGIEALEGEAAQAVALLALVAGQDVEPAEGSDGTDGRWRIARQTAPDRVISTVDTDARHAHKTRHKRQDGFKAHVLVEPDTGLITATELTKASGADSSDAAVGQRLLGLARSGGQTHSPAGGEVPGGSDRWEVLADSAYGSGPMLQALDTAGHVAVIKPWPLKSLIENGFTIADFTVDETAGEHGTVTCPAGLTRAMTAKRAAYFKAACTGCPLRSRCTTSAAGRTVTVGEHDALQRAHRARAADPDFQAVYRQHRPMVERSIAWLTRGNRRVPFRGITKNNAWLQTRIAALNLRRLLALGLQHQAGRWVLA